MEAQREALARFAATEGFEVVREFVEIETGKGADALDAHSSPLRSQKRAVVAALSAWRNSTA